jgi:cytoskeletal protein CcmA (bactofilin family)
MFRRRLDRAGRGSLTAFIDEGSEIEGRYAFRGALMLNGRFKGELTSPDTLIVGEKAVVHGEIHAGQVVVRGEIVGNVTATERIELRGAARLIGDIDAPVVVVEEGVLFEGHCRMTRRGQGAEAPVVRDLSVVPLKR